MTLLVYSYPVIPERQLVRMIYHALALWGYYCPSPENYIRMYSYFWKTANVLPIFKKENKQLVEHYRPVSLLPIMAKLFERLLFRTLYNYF